MAKASRAGTRPAATRGAGRAADPLWDRFLRELAVVLPILELEVGGESGDLVTLTTADGQRKGKVNLASLFRVVSGKPRSQWFALIHRFLSAAGPAAAASAAAGPLAQGLGAGADRLLPCLKPSFGRRRGPHVWSLPLIDPDVLRADLVAALVKAPLSPAAKARLVHRHAGPAAANHPCVALGIDLPDTIAFVTGEMLAEAGRPPLFWLTRALANLRQRTPAHWSRLLDRRTGLRCASLRDSYDAARALILDELLPDAAPCGWFVAPVARDTLYFLPASAAAAVESLFPLRMTAAQEFASADHSISREVYWVHRGTWHAWQFVPCGDVVITVKPRAFSRVAARDTRAPRIPRPSPPPS